MKKRVFQLYDLRAPEKSICISCDYSDERAKRIDSVTNYLDASYDGETFSDMLIRYMHEKSLTSREIYKRSYIDRKLLNKILNDSEYHPSKKTAFALCIALRLSYWESTVFLQKANYSFTNTKRYDLIFAYILQNRIYDIDTINMFLDYYHFPCLGE